MSARAGLSTHVLDLTRGRPAAGMTIELWFAGAHVKTVVTNADGRTDAPLLESDGAGGGGDSQGEARPPGAAFQAGEYELIFHVGEYFDRVGKTSMTVPPRDRFLDRVPVRFTIHDTTARYHVPLLCTPWAYSTYRGS
jgi:5-hydroxyisourate hydrolase